MSSRQRSKALPFHGPMLVTSQEKPKTTDDRVFPRKKRSNRRGRCRWSKNTGRQRRRAHAPPRGMRAMGFNEFCMITEPYDFDTVYIFVHPN